VGEDAIDAIYGIENYLNLKVGKKGKRSEIQIWDKWNFESIRTPKKGEKYESDAIYSYKQNYEKGIEYASETDVNNTIARLKLPNWTLWEAYFLLKVYVYDPKTQRFYFDFEENTFQMDSKGGSPSCYHLFGRMPNSNIIRLETGCRQ
jgi:hypothetical protein